MSRARTVCYINLARNLSIKCIESIVVSIVKLLFFLIPKLIGIAPHLIVRDNVLSEVCIYYHCADLLFDLSVVRHDSIKKRWEVWPSLMSWARTVGISESDQCMLG